MIENGDHPAFVGAGSNASAVDYSAGHGRIPYSSAVLSDDTVTLTGYAVHLLTYPSLAENATSAAVAG